MFGVIDLTSNNQHKFTTCQFDYSKKVKCGSAMLQMHPTRIVSNNIKRTIPKSENMTLSQFALGIQISNITQTVSGNTVQ